MPARPAHVCSLRSDTEALAAGELPTEQRDALERHLEQCQPCRTLFRQRTAARYPRIRNYTILRELGRGGFGVVYKALQHSKQRAEALKVLFGASPQRTAYFENEVRLAAHLRHPNIATLYEASLKSAPLYYAMELVEGEQLDEYLHDHGVLLEQRLELFRQLAAAVGYAHAQGVIHRDLKPQNVLVDAQARPHVVDFGIAKRFDVGVSESPPPDGAAHEGALGTFGYIAPEQLAGDPLDARADVYSLGALLFHIITGEPARLATESVHFARLLHERAVARADDLAAIIACCLKPLPADRYPTCGSLVEDLDRYLAGREVRARRDSTTGVHLARLAALTVRNHPAAAQAAAAAVAAVLLSAVFWTIGVRWSTPGGQYGQTVLVAFLPSTQEAIRRGRYASELPGLDADKLKSWRLLYGRLLAALADAHPRVIVWDYFFRDGQPAYDPEFVRGLRGAGAPVVVGTEDWDINGEPLIAPEIRAVIHGCGKLQATLPTAEEVHVPLAAQRGFNPPTPALALAGLAAARQPQCAADIAIFPDRLELRYRQRRTAPGELRYLLDSDSVPLFKTEEGHEDRGGPRPVDRYCFGRFPHAELPAWTERPIAMEDVLTADVAQRRRWFEGRAVLIGQMLPGKDLRPYAPGRSAFGCQWQATFLDDLLAGRFVNRMSRAALAPCACLWSALALAVVRLVPLPRTWPVRGVNLIGAVLVIAGLAFAIGANGDANRRWETELLIALSASLVAGAGVWVVQSHHRQQWQLTPEGAWDADSTTTTMLALSPAGRASRGLQDAWMPHASSPTHTPVAEPASPDSPRSPADPQRPAPVQALAADEVAPVDGTAAFILKTPESGVPDSSAGVAAGMIAATEVPAATGGECRKRPGGAGPTATPT